MAPQKFICEFCKVEFIADGLKSIKGKHAESCPLFDKRFDSAVEHPTHYNWIPRVECMDVVKYFDFALGNVLKYIWRAGYKSTSTKLEDLKKAKYYLEIAIEMEEENGT